MSKSIPATKHSLGGCEMRRRHVKRTHVDHDRVVDELNAFIRAKGVESAPGTAVAVDPKDQTALAQDAVTWPGVVSVHDAGRGMLMILFRDTAARRANKVRLRNWLRRRE